MLRTLTPYRWLLEPVVALLVAAVWVVFALPWGPPRLVVVIILCAALAISRISPGLSLGVAAVGLICELSHASALPVSVAWPAYPILLIILFGTGAHASGAARWIGLVCAAIFGGIAALPVVSSGFRLAPLGVDPSSSPSELATIALCGIVLSVGLGLAWLAGLLVDRRRNAAPPEQETLGVWLARPVMQHKRAPDSDRGAGVFRPLPPSARGVDLVLAVAFLALCVLQGGEGASGAGFAVAGLFAAGIGLRRLSPSIAISVAWLAAIVQMLSGGTIGIMDVAVLVVLYATASYGDGITRWVGLGSVGVGAFVSAGYLTLTSSFQVVSSNLTFARIGSIALQFGFLLVLSLAVLGVSWLLGFLVRTRRRSAESRQALALAEAEERDARARVIVEQERNRIARDMHDVVAHSLAVVIAQADGARYARAADPDAVDGALVAISTTAREALGDVRVLLTQLRHSDSDGPQPSLADLDALLAQLTGAGVRVRKIETGQPRELPASVQLAVYRIAQEALTNALRHGADGAPVLVHLAWSEAELILIVTNTPRIRIDANPHSRPDAGHGIPGMRERALLSGGSFDVRRETELFTIEARVPIGTRR